MTWGFRTTRHLLRLRALAHSAGDRWKSMWNAILTSKSASTHMYWRSHPIEAGLRGPQRSEEGIVLRRNTYAVPVAREAARTETPALSNAELYAIPGEEEISSFHGVVNQSQARP